MDWLQSGDPSSNHEQWAPGEGNMNRKNCVGTCLVFPGNICFCSSLQTSFCSIIKTFLFFNPWGNWVELFFHLFFTSTTTHAYLSVLMVAILQIDISTCMLIFIHNIWTTARWCGWNDWHKMNRYIFQYQYRCGCGKKRSVSHCCGPHQNKLWIYSIC